MARMPEARWRPLPENSTQPPIRATQLILHTAVDAPGPTDLYRYFARADVSLEAHFWVPYVGQLEQHIDTDRSADANYKANRRADGTGAISVETEDDGSPAQRPWTEKQLRDLVAVGVWACRTHGIPARRCRSHTDPGIGYHSMWGAPSPWTNAAGKTCPGPARIAQVDQVIARVAAQLNTPPPVQEDDAMGTYIRDSESGAIFHFYGERFRHIKNLDDWRRRSDLAALGGRPIQLQSMHPWALAKFVIDFKLIEDPPTK